MPTEETRSCRSAPSRAATRDTYGSNTVRVTARYDERTGHVIALGGVGQSRKRRRRPSCPGGEHRSRPRGDRRPIDAGDRAVSVVVPRGFVASGVAAGIKADGQLDLALVATEDAGPCQQGRCSPPISWLRRPCRSAGPISPRPGRSRQLWCSTAAVRTPPRARRGAGTRNAPVSFRRLLWG